MDLNAAFFKAAKNGDLKTIKAFIKNGQNVNAVDDKQYSAVQLASCDDDNIKVLEELASAGAVLDLKRKGGATALHIASATGSHQIMRCLVQKGVDVNIQDNDDETPLHYAVECDDGDVIITLKALGGNLEAENSNQHTPLMRAIQKRNKKIIQSLVENGAVLNPAPDKALSPLLYAVHGDDLDMAKLIIKLGADINWCGSIGPALLIAMAMENIEMVQFLSDHDADVNFTDEKGNFLIHIAIAQENEDIVKALLNNGANVNARGPDGRIPAFRSSISGDDTMLKVLLQYKPDLNIKSNKESSALLAATQNNHVTTMELLIGGGADVNLKGPQNQTPIFIAANRGNTAALQCLLEHGADPNIPAAMDTTPLHIASSQGHLKCVMLLLEFGCNPGKKDKSGRTCLEAATQEEHEDVVAFFFKFSTALNNEQTPSVEADSSPDKAPSTIKQNLKEIDIKSPLPTSLVLKDTEHEEIKSSTIHDDKAEVIGETSKVNESKEKAVDNPSPEQPVFSVTDITPQDTRDKGKEILSKQAQETNKSREAAKDNLAPKSPATTPDHYYSTSAAEYCSPRVDKELPLPFSSLKIEKRAPPVPKKPVIVPRRRTDKAQTTVDKTSNPSLESQEPTKDNTNTRKSRVSISDRFLAMVEANKSEEDEGAVSVFSFTNK